MTHVTFTDDHDRDLLRDSGSTVVHCPIRKAREAVISPYYEYVERGINVALGTDSYTSDIASNLGAAARLGKIKMGPGRCSHCLRRLALCDALGGERAGP